MRTHYWSCTKFADWLRGTPKISAGTSKEWDAWEKMARMRSLRYWLAEDLLDWLQELVKWPQRRAGDLRHYLHNRYISKTHALTSNLERGQFYEFETRLLHCAFDELVNFVEIDEAWLHLACSEEARQKHRIPFYRRLLGMRFRRYPEAGLEYLEWAATLTHGEDEMAKQDPRFGQSTPQALAAKETIALYNWWTEERPKRPDPMQASGLSEFYDKKQKIAEAQGDSSLFGLDTPLGDEEKLHYDQMSDRCRKMEQAHENEDTEMLIRLIKLRKHLWS